MTLVIPELERQLRAAVKAQRAARTTEETYDRPLAAGTGGRASLPRRGLSMLSVAVPVAAAIAVAAVSLVLLSGHDRKPSPPVIAESSRQHLTDILSVLRRSQTKADLNPRLLRALPPARIAGFTGTPDLPLIRYATTTPWGERVYVVPMRPPGRSQIASITRGLPRAQAARLTAALRLRGETAGLFSPSGGGGSTSTPAEIDAGDAILTEGAGGSFAGGSTRTRYVVLVPDGVARVTFVAPRQPSPGEPGAPIYRHSLAITVAVHDNVAAVQVDRQGTGARPAMIWYAPGGRVIKRVGNFRAVNRVTPPPRQGPQTAHSRAAERDPSTPNRVWVTPAAGGPHTNFKVHFQVLLDDADYSYRLTGTRCPQITLNGGDGGGTNDLRGRIWTDVIDAVAGQAWCPGAYHLSVTIMDRGRYGALKRPAAPFGTATFTVRR